MIVFGNPSVVIFSLDNNLSPCLHVVAHSVINKMGGCIPGNSLPLKKRRRRNDPRPMRHGWAVTYWINKELLGDEINWRMAVVLGRAQVESLFCWPSIHPGQAWRAWRAWHLTAVRSEDATRETQSIVAMIIITRPFLWNWPQILSVPPSPSLSRDSTPVQVRVRDPQSLWWLVDGWSARRRRRRSPCVSIM